MTVSVFVKVFTGSISIKILDCDGNLYVTQIGAEKLFEK